jgi:imidazolonepropionase-like amidohydrolase
MYTAWLTPGTPELEKQMPITLIRTAALALALFVFTGTCLGHDAPAAAATTTAVPAIPVALFQNVRIYDGKGSTLSAPASVLVRGNRIERISLAPIPAEPEATVIVGNGRTLMPGLIDAHWHTMLVRSTPVAAISGDIGYNNLLAGAEATDTLMRGFTTVRDLGGPAFGLKQVIDEGIEIGPRIYSSGAMITITGGHGDFRQTSGIPRVIGGALTRMEVINGSMVADTPDEVRIRVREQLMQDASQIKLMAEKGIWLSIQPFLDDADAIPFPSGSTNRTRQLEVIQGTDIAYALAKQYKVKTAFGTDILFSRALAQRQGAQLTKFTRWYNVPELLKMATSTNAELLQMSGLRNASPGKLGVVEEGTLADLLLVHGNPIDNIRLIEDPDKHFVVVMKAGRIHTNMIDTDKAL